MTQDTHPILRAYSSKSSEWEYLLFKSKPTNASQTQPRVLKLTIFQDSLYVLYNGTLKNLFL